MICIINANRIRLVCPLIYSACVYTVCVCVCALLVFAVIELCQKLNNCLKCEILPTNYSIYIIMITMNELVDLRMQQHIAHEIYRQQIMQRIPGK